MNAMNDMHAADQHALVFRNESINAIVEWANTSTGEPLEAQTCQKPLQCWRFAVKSNIAVAGLAWTAGIGAYRQRIATSDAFVVERLRLAGATIVGTVNMEEAALGAVTDNPHFGRTQNPRRIGYTPGGSSGGSAAAVAAGLARVAIGTDTMGSCRLPAAYCGVVGFKPSFGRFSVRGVEPLSQRLDHVGILAATVQDVQATFAVLNDFDPLSADATVCENIDATAVTHRLAVLDNTARAGLTLAVRTAYEYALATIGAHGYTLVPRAVDLAALASMRRAGLLICEAELANSLAPLLARDDAGVSPSLKKMIAYGAARSAPQLAAAHSRIDDAVLILRAQLDGVDAIVWPTAPQTAFPFEQPAPANQADFTCLANFTGAPAISLPLPAPDGELPAGLQLMGPCGADALLLKLADQLSGAIAV